MATSVIIPALNEAPVIGQVVTRLRECQVLREAGITDIVVVDNGSDDETATMARAAGARVVQEPQRGYGRACLAGVLAAKDTDVIVLMDGDGSDVPEDILRVWEPVQAGAADLAMGSRVRGHCEPGALMPQQRVGNAVGAILLRLLYGVRVSDIGPLRAIRRETLLRLEMSEMTYGWSVEMLAKAGRLGLRVQEVPVDYRKRAGGRSKVAGTICGTVKASGRILRTITRHRRWQPSGTRTSVKNSSGPHAWRLKIAARGLRPQSPPARAKTKRRLLDRRSRREGNPHLKTHLEEANKLPQESNPSRVEVNNQSGEYKTIIYEPRKAVEQEAVLTSCPKRALFIVARAPVAGQTKTRLGAVIGHEAATVLYQAFLQDLGARFTRAAARDGYDLYWFYAAPCGLSEAEFAASVPSGAGFIRQHEGDFAARLWQGFQAVRGRGYERIVVIGSDSPHLPAAWVAQAFAALERDEVVLGPARDGGYYLLGQRGTPVDLFSGITMSTSTVYAETLARAQAAGLRVALTPATFDIDEVDDLNRLREALYKAPSAEADPAPETQRLLSTLTAHAGDAPLNAIGSAEGVAHGNN
jgi:rSAM/selenodomain-associated transferase 1